MKINKLDIKGFGTFEDREFLLQPGLNVIFGCNESGKSTLQAFIRSMFFGLKSGRRTKDGALPPAKKYKPWFTQAYGGIMEYQLEDGRRFTVGRNFDRNTLNLCDEFFNQITGEFPADKDGVRFAEQHLGLSENCFQRTVWIGQMQSAVDGEGRKILAERLMNLSQSGDEEISCRKAQKALREAQLSHVGSGRSTTRPLNLVDAQLKEARKQEEEGICLHGSRLELFLELEKIRQEQCELNRELEKWEKIREALQENAGIQALNDSYHRLRQYHQQICEAEERKKKKNAEKHELERRIEAIRDFQNFSRQDADNMLSDYTRYQLLAQEHEDAGNAADENEEKLEPIEATLTQYALFERDRNEMEEALNAVMRQNCAQTEKKDRETGEKVYPVRKGLLSIMGVCGAILTLSGVILYRELAPKPLFLLPVLFGAILLLLMGAKWLTYLRKSMRRKDQRPAVENHRLRLQQEENQSRLNQWMEEARVENLSDFIRLKSLVEDKARRREELLAEKTRLKENEKATRSRLEELRERILGRLRQANLPFGFQGFSEEDILKWKTNLELFHSLQAEKKAVEVEAEALVQREEGILREASLTYGETIESREMLIEAIQQKRARMDMKKPVEIEQDTCCDQAEHQVEALREKIQQNLLQINTLTTRVENIPDEELLQQAREKVQSLTKEREQRIFLGKALDTAMQVLTEASLCIQRDYVPALNREMSAVISTVTGGKYADIHADDSLLLNIMPGELTESVLPEQLSSGTADQVYFALRLAAVRLVERKGEALPLFLDEPFAQYDEERTRNALRLLLEESQGRQIFLFTCSKQEVEWVREVFQAQPHNIIELGAVSTG